MSGIDAVSALAPNDKNEQEAQKAWDKANKAVYDASEERRALLADIDALNADYVQDMAAADPDERAAIKERYDEQLAALQADVTAAEQERDRAQLERTYAGKGLEAARQQDAALQTIADQAMADLQAAQAQAATLGNPEEQARFYQMRQKQITETAKLQQQLLEATDADEQARLQQKLDLLAFAQQQETALYQLEAERRAQALEEQAGTIQAGLDELGIDLSTSDLFTQGQALGQALIAGLQSQIALFNAVPTSSTTATSTASATSVPSGDTYNIYVTIPSGQPATADIQRLVTDAVAAALRQAARQGDIRNRTGG
jgi:hypothetical protein